MNPGLQPVREAEQDAAGASADAASAPTAAAEAAADVLLIGHSHALALWHGYHTASFPFVLRYLDLLAAGIAEAVAATRDGIVPPLREFVDSNPAAPVLLSYAGNEHNLLALVEHPEPFDFEHADGAPPDPRRWIVPARVMRAHMAAYVERLRRWMHGFRAAFPGRAAWLLLPPPPLPDPDHIAAHPAVFAEKVATCGVAPYAVRHKVWRLQCELMREFAAETGMAVLEAPASALDGEGRLRRDAWGNDAVHASTWYGEQQLRELQPRIRAARAEAR
jgi:hypothetical protein